MGLAVVAFDSVAVVLGLAVVAFDSVAVVLGLVVVAFESVAVVLGLAAVAFESVVGVANLLADALFSAECGANLLTDDFVSVVFATATFDSAVVAFALLTAPLALTPAVTFSLFLRIRKNAVTPPATSKTPIMDNTAAKSLLDLGEGFPPGTVESGSPPISNAFSSLTISPKPSKASLLGAIPDKLCIFSPLGDSVLVVSS